MKKIFRYLAPYKKWVIFAPLLMTVEVICDLLQPHFLSEIIDRGLAHGDMGFVLHTGGLMLGVACLGILGGVGCSFFAAKTSQHLGKDLRNDLFQKIQSFSYGNLDVLPAPTLITRLTNDVMQIQNFTLMMLRIMVRAPLMCIGGILMALLINPWLALSALGSIPILAFILAFVIRRAFPFFESVQKRMDRVNTVMRATLSGIRVVKAFVRSDYEQKRFGKANEELTDTTITANRVIGTTTPIMMLLMNISIVLLLWFGGYRVNNGEISMGQIMALINYVMQILFSLMMSAMLLMSVSRAQASSQRIVEVLETEATIQNPTETSTFCDHSKDDTVLRFSHVFFHYTGSRGAEVLNDINFELKGGETLAILGSTGAGKSSLVNLIPRFYDPDAGVIEFFGNDLKTLDLYELRNQIGIVPQEALLFSGSIRENLRWGNPEASDKDIRLAAGIAQAHDFINALTLGYDTVLGQRGVNLSGGQKQRLCLARALVKKPRLLILDDSTSAVDLETEARIQEGLRVNLGQTSCVLIAQRISSVMDADRIIVLEEGKILSMGIHEELLETSPVYQDIYRSQVGPEVN